MGLLPLYGNYNPDIYSPRMKRIGIIGLGFMAATHIKAYRKIDGAQIAAVCNPSGKHLDGDLSDVAGNIGDQDPVKLDMSEIKAYRDVDEFLSADDLDVIDICTPTKTHLQLSKAALKAGKHVFLEKPMARTKVEADLIVEAANASDKYLMPAMCLRFWPQWAWLKKAVHENRFGKVLSAHFQRIAEPPAWGHSHYFKGADSGGALLDLHIHDTDFVNFLFGKPQRIFSIGYSKFTGAIDHVVTDYLFDDGPTVSAEGGWSMTPGFGFKMAYHVNFENATVDYDITRTDELLRLFEKDKDKRIIDCGEEDGYVLELRHFLQSIEKGTPPSVVTPSDGSTAVEICEAEEKSILTREIVTL